MDVSAEAVARVPGENVRVSRVEFGALWALAERLGERAADGRDYLVGVILTCRWLAAQPVWSSVLRRFEMPCTPLTWRRHAAMPETVEAELLAAYSANVTNRELARGTSATLEWAWRGSGRPPLDLGHAAVG